jgi:protein tyrosine phosphatase
MNQFINQKSLITALTNSLNLDYFQSLQSNVLDYQSLQDFTKNKTSIYDEFKEIPQVSVRVDEVPENCEDKNRYANVVPLPETRVHLQRLSDDEKTEYINANYVKVINV